MSTSFLCPREDVLFSSLFTKVLSFVIYLIKDAEISPNHQRGFAKPHRGLANQNRGFVDLR